MDSLKLDSVLPDYLTFQGGEINGNPKDILVTGSTGFLGSYLIVELMERTEAILHCLVRGESAETARQRLVGALSLREVWNEAWTPRLRVYPSDLEAEALGLDKETECELAATIDAIYHCGAKVNFAMDYSKLKTANVDGTKAIIDLACRGKPKSLHHISTLSVFDQVAFFNRSEITEETALELLGAHLTGYAATKWAAEQLVIAARERGVTTSIHRPGNIAGATNSGLWNHSDLVPRAIKSCIQIGGVPELGVSFSLTPVDFVARAVVAVTLLNPPYYAAYHPIADRFIAFTDISGWLRTAGYRLDRLPYEMWQSRLREALQRGERNALGALAHLFLAPLPEGGDLTLPELFMGGRRPRYGNDAMATAIGRENMPAAIIDETIFHKYLKRWIADGFLPAPA